MLSDSVIMGADTESFERYLISRIWTQIRYFRLIVLFTIYEYVFFFYYIDDYFIL